MGTAFCSAGSPSNGEGVTLTPVVLNVYDLTPLNNYVQWLGIGIFHSGIEVHGLEYGFGAHDFPTSGVFEVEPKTCPGFLYRCSILLGQTTMPPAEFRTFIESIATEYHGDTYHLISKNCNHFTDDVSKRLTGKPIPQWVNRLAGLGAVCNCLLPESLRLPAVKQITEYQGLSEDGSESFSVVTTATHDPLESDDADQDRHLLSGGELSIVKEPSSFDKSGTSLGNMQGTSHELEMQICNCFHFFFPPTPENKSQLNNRTAVSTTPFGGLHRELISRN